MSDIRNFFSKESNTNTNSVKKSARRRVINDSDEDDIKVEIVDLSASNEDNKGQAAVQPNEYFGAGKISKTPAKRSTRAKKEDQDNEYDDNFSLDEEDLEMIDSQSKPSSAVARADQSPEDKQPPVAQESLKRKSVFTDSVTNEASDEKATPSAGTKRLKSDKSGNNSSPKKTSSKAKEEDVDKKPSAVRKVADVTQSSSSHAILESIPLVEVPEPGEPVKFQFGQKAQAPSAPGSKEIPEGAEGCLSGLTFVFTGVLDSLERSEAQDLVRKYGAKVTTAPSKNTSFVVLGQDAGPKKIEKIGKLGVKVIDEDGLLKLISSMPPQGGDNVSAQKAVEKRAMEEKKARDTAIEMERSEAKQRKQNTEKIRAAKSTGETVKIISATERLWTSKYAPTAMKDMIGNKANIDKLSRFLADWPKNLKAKFKKPGPDGMGLYRALLISGPPGIGKTTSAHLVANLAGYDIVEFNASDTRSKKLLEEGLKGVVNNTSLNGYFGVEASKVDTGKRRLVLIMDEVDGMSAGDRGGVGALNAVIRKTSIPIICICNDRSSQKLKPLDKTTFDLRFSKPTKDQVRSRIMSIAFKEGLTISPQAIDQLVESTGSDIRQIINLLSTYRLTMSNMDHSQGKAGAKSAEKHVILKPWDIVSKFLNGAMYNERSKTTLNEKIELYFNDHDMSYLMVQENYLNTNPDRARAAGNAKEQEIKRLKLFSQAASAISDGDLVDAMIHGSQQQWSLMPVHAVFSCVRPASLIAGPGGRPNFTSVLGNMSKLNKANRLLREIRAHLRLRTSGDRHEIRRDYIPMFFKKLPKALELGGVDSIPQIIEVMDEYFLTKDDYDSLLDLGIGENDKDQVEGRIASATKSSFTRQYNKGSHPTAFIPTAGGPPPKKVSAADMPDFEDAVELSEDEAAVGVNEDEVSDDDSPIDLKKDKFIQAPKKSKAAATTSKKGKAKDKKA